MSVPEIWKVIPETWSIPGEGVSEAEFDEYHINDQELYKMIIQHFYREVE